MKCSNHPKSDAVAECAECGRPFCAECIVASTSEAGAGTALRGSWRTREQGARVHPGWRKLAAALLSIVPGRGHMFLGLIGKGFALMGLLIASVFLVILYSDATGMYWMTAYLVPALWACSSSATRYSTPWPSPTRAAAGGSCPPPTMTP